MALTDELVKGKAAILGRWRKKIVATYPEQAGKFLSKQKNQFANPVGHAIIESTDGLFDWVVGDEPVKTVFPILERVIHIRAIQEFNPSQAVAFVFFLKEAIRNELRKILTASDRFQELLCLESRIDCAAMAAFDVHCASRERVYQIRVRESQWVSSRIVERINERFLAQTSDSDTESDTPCGCPTSEGGGK
jgi:RsbT co-antagonist protein rsbRD N-terminal domain